MPALRNNVALRDELGVSPVLWESLWTELQTEDGTTLDKGQLLFLVEENSQALDASKGSECLTYWSLGTFSVCAIFSLLSKPSCLCFLVEMQSLFQDLETFHAATSEQLSALTSKYDTVMQARADAEDRLQAAEQHTSEQLMQHKLEIAALQQQVSELESTRAAGEGKQHELETAKQQQHERSSELEARLVKLKEKVCI